MTRPTALYGIAEGDILPGRKRLLNSHKELGSWQAVADRMKLNWRYVWDFAVNGKLPRNPAIRKKLLGKKSINEHLSTDRIQDIPEELLNWAMENRIDYN